MANRIIPVPYLKPLPRGEELLENVAENIGDLYKGDRLLRWQTVLSLFGVTICSFLTPNAEPPALVPNSRGLTYLYLYASLLVGLIYLYGVNKDMLCALGRAVRNRYRIILFCARAVGIVAVLRIFVVFGNDLDKVDDVNGFSIAAFLFGYLHIISLCKLMNLHDVLSFADSLLAIAVLISAKLEVATKLEHPIRIFSTYLSILVLVMFRNAKVPFEKVTAAQSKGLPPVTYSFGGVQGCTHAIVILSTRRNALSFS